MDMFLNKQEYQIWVYGVESRVEVKPKDVRLALHQSSCPWQRTDHQSRARRALTLFNKEYDDVQMRTRRALLLYKEYDKSTLLVLN